MGKFDDPLLPPAPKTRQVYDRPDWTGYEVVLDVWPDVFAWGILLVPKDIAPGERRPVVVCQHGRNGLPTDVDRRRQTGLPRLRRPPGRRGLHRLRAAQPLPRRRPLPLARPQGEHVKATLFSFILGQHEQTPPLARRRCPSSTAARIAFYGLSYGGETAVRVPAVLERYCLSICSGDFNEWVAQGRLDRLALQLHVHRRMGDALLRPGQHVQLRRDGLPDRPAAVHGRARPPRRRRHGRMGRLRVRQGPPAVRRSSAWATAPRSSSSTAATRSTAKAPSSSCESTWRGRRIATSRPPPPDSGARSTLPLPYAGRWLRRDQPWAGWAGARARGTACRTAAGRARHA